MPLGVIIDSTYSRRHSMKSALERSKRCKKMTLPETTTVFRRALPTKTYSTGGILKGGVPVNTGVEGASFFTRNF